MELALVYTLKCNARCRHCGFNCSPTANSKIDIKKAEGYIRKAADIDEVKRIVFTGGEPLLYHEEICRLIAYTTKLGMTSRIVTNAFWAKSKAVAKDIVKELTDSGLTNINFSADMFHQEYVNCKNVENAIEASHEFGLVPVIARCVTNKSHGKDEFLTLYGLAPNSVIDVKDIPVGEMSYMGNRDFKIREKYRSKVLVRESNMIPRGRALQIRHYCREEAFGEIFDEACTEVIQKPGIFPNGNLYACCCSGEPVEMLNVGNLEETSLETLFHRMHENSVFWFLSQYGPYRLARLLEKRQMIRNPKRASSVCEICLDTLDAWDGHDFQLLLEDHFAMEILEGLSEPVLRPKSSS